MKPGIGVTWSYTITSSHIPVQGRNSVLGYHLTWMMAKPIPEVWEVPFSWRGSSKITSDPPQKSPGRFSSCLEGLMLRLNSSFEPGRRVVLGAEHSHEQDPCLDTGANLWEQEVMG